MLWPSQAYSIPILALVIVSGYWSLAQPGLPTALALALKIRSCSPAGEPPYQAYSKPWVLFLLGSASTQSDMAHPQSWLLLAGVAAQPSTVGCDPHYVLAPV